jgi:hypothetical protein
MAIQYDCTIIRHLKGYIRKPYLEFLLNNGCETRRFYKHALKIAKKLYIYRDPNIREIKGILGINDTVSIEKSVTTPMISICFIPFIYCTDDNLFRRMIKDIEEYAMKHGQPWIAMAHMLNNDTMLLEAGYERDEYEDYPRRIFCAYCEYKEYPCVYNVDACSYIKDIFDKKLARIIYCKEYDPNKDYYKSFKEYYCDVLDDEPPWRILPSKIRATVNI